MKEIIENFMQLNRLQQLIMLASVVDAQMAMNARFGYLNQDVEDLTCLAEYMEVVVGYTKIEHVSSENLLFNQYPIK